MHIRRYYIVAVGINDLFSRPFPARRFTALWLIIYGFHNLYTWDHLPPPPTVQYLRFWLKIILLTFLNFYFIRLFSSFITILHFKFLLTEFFFQPRYLMKHNDIKLFLLLWGILKSLSHVNSFFRVPFQKRLKIILICVTYIYY